VSTEPSIAAPSLSATARQVDVTPATFAQRLPGSLVPVLTAALDLDARMTADRDEQKYLLPATSARALVERLDQRLRPHRFRGANANPLPGARHFVTTIYFDTPARELYRRAHAPVNLKLRAKEYYDLHPAMVELATDPRQLLRYQPVIWLELKARDHARTRKRRLAVHKRHVAALLADGRVPEAALAADPDILLEMASLSRELGAPLEPSAVVSYRRRAWQDATDSLRVTLDLQVAFFAPPADLLTRTTPLLRENLPPPVHTEPHVIVEVKSTAAATADPADPAWLYASLAELGGHLAPYSKFETASRVLHG
jgi:hypothetical protein